MTNSNELIKKIQNAYKIQNPLVYSAFRKIDRALFTGEDQGYSKLVYDNSPVPIKFDTEGKVLSSSTQPSLMATMLDKMEIFEGANVLEIGTGSGYNAAIMSEITGKKGLVCSLDSEPDVIQKAEKSIQKSNNGNVKLFHRDASEGIGEYAPFDSIICTAGCSQIPFTWYEQLKINGQLLLPLMFKGLTFCCSLKKNKLGFKGNILFPCGFMPIRGRLYNVKQQALLIERLDLLLENNKHINAPDEFLFNNKKNWMFKLYLFQNSDKFQVVLEKKMDINPDFNKQYSFGLFDSVDSFALVMNDKVYYNSEKLLEEMMLKLKEFKAQNILNYPDLNLFFEKHIISHSNYQQYSDENYIGFKY